MKIIQYDACVNSYEGTEMNDIFCYPLLTFHISNIFSTNVIQTLHKASLGEGFQVDLNGW